MGLHRIFFVLWIFTSYVRSTKHKLYCSNDPSASTTLQPPARLIASPPIGRTNIARDERVKVELDACCGPKPFYTGFSTCCMGKAIRRSSRRCCISGPPVPKHRKCTCHPHSGWIRREVNKFEELRSRTISLMEDVINAKERLLKIINEKERLVGELDARASNLYEAFLEELNIERGQDLEEVEYIYELVTFLHSNEEESLERSFNEEEFMGIPQKEILRDAPVIFDQDLEKMAKQGLLEYLNTLLKSVKSGKTTLSYVVYEIKIAGRNSIVQNESWKPIIKKQNIVSEHTAEEEFISEEEDFDVEALVQKRNQILKQIRTENKFIVASVSYVEELEKMEHITKSEEKVIRQLNDLLNEAFEIALEIEDERRALELEAELEAEGGSFDSVRLPTDVNKMSVGAEEATLEPGCNVTSWANNFSNMKSQIDEKYVTLEEILDFIPNNKRKNR